MKRVYEPLREALKLVRFAPPKASAGGRGSYLFMQSHQGESHRQTSSSDEHANCMQSLSEWQALTVNTSAQSQRP